MRTYQARPKSKYTDPRWQKKRLEVMQRDGFACICCGEDKDTLNVHHSYYVAGRDLWEYPPSTLLTLCQMCHKQHSEDPGGFIEKTNRYLDWWEGEVEEATKLMLSAGTANWPNISFYQSIEASDAVLLGAVDPVDVCNVICDAARYLLSKEWLEKLKAEVDAEKVAYRKQRNESFDSGGGK